MLLFSYQNQTGVDILNSSHIEDLGSLVAGLDRKTLRKIAKDAFIDHLYNIARAKGYDVKKLKEIAKLAKQHFDKRLVCKIICCIPSRYLFMLGNLVIENEITIFREEATSALACFHVGPLSWSSWNLEMLVFVEVGKLENLEKNPQSKVRTNNKLNPHMTAGPESNPGHTGGRRALSTLPHPC